MGNLGTIPSLWPNARTAMMSEAEAASTGTIRIPESAAVAYDLLALRFLSTRVYLIACGE